MVYCFAQSVVGVVELWNHCCEVLHRDLQTWRSTNAQWFHSSWSIVLKRVCMQVRVLLFRRVVVASTFAFRFVGCCFDVLSPLFFQERRHFACFG